jgi:hypothetical protein
VCLLDSTACSFDFPAVPKNHRLVVQHVSGFLVFGAGDGKGAQVTLDGGANGALSSFIAPTSFLGESLLDQPVLQYIDAGSAPILVAIADVILDSSSNATISGYLLDCVTTALRSDRALTASRGQPKKAPCERGLSSFVELSPRSFVLSP